ncbi:MAG: hypothetical protein SFV21_22060 [Rhodospirillaceae bacterium]|nr:hypothetical protein [Rhodospirillaceae bacterium]
MASTTEVAGPGTRIIWVVSRALLKHETFTVPANLSVAQRRATLTLMIRRWAPFQAAGHAVSWAGPQACVYAWDEDKVAAAIAAAGLDRAKCTIVPETFLRAPAADGVRLVACIDGVEGQVWSNAMLLATRWWARPPSAAEWSGFIRVARLGPVRADLGRPDVSNVAFMDAPWALRRDLLADALTLLDTPQYRAAAVALALAVPVFLGAKLTAMASTTADLQVEVNRLLAASEPVRAQRDATLANLDAADRMLALEPFPSQFDALAQAFALLNGQNVKIIDWTYDTGVIEMSIEGDGDLEATRFIELFEQDPLFAEVSARTLAQSRSLRLKFNLSQPAGGRA